MAKDCTNPKHYEKDIARKLEHHNKKKTQNSVHLVLEHLCRQLDHEKVISNGVAKTTVTIKIYLRDLYLIK